MVVLMCSDKNRKRIDLASDELMSQFETELMDKYTVSGHK